MRNVNRLCVALVGLSLVAGCEREQASNPAPAPAPTPTPVPAPSASADTSSPAPTTRPSFDTDRTAADARAAGDRAAAGARSAVDQAAAGASDAGARPGDAASPAQEQTAAAAQLTTEQAKTMLDQAVTYVKENKYDLAEKTLNQVEAHKASLPKAMQDQVGTVRTMLNTAKAGGGLQIPGLGGSK